MKPLNAVNASGTQESKAAEHPDEHPDEQPDAAPKPIPLGESAPVESLGELSPTLEHMLNNIRDDEPFSTETESLEVRTLTKYQHDLDLYTAMLSSEDVTRWPKMAQLKNMYARFCNLHVNNAQSRVGQDVYKALISNNVYEIRRQFHTLVIHVRATLAGLVNDSPAQRGHSMISDRQRQALKNWRWVPEQNGYDSFDNMSAHDANVILGALIDAKKQKKQNHEVVTIIDDSAAA